MELTVDSEGPDWQVTAAYRMDLVERLTARGGGTVRPRLVYAAKDSLAAVHRRVPALRRPLTATSNAVRRRLGWRTTFEPAGLVATVPVTYTVRGGEDVVTVAADLTGVPAGAVTEVVLMNELGAGHFDRYEDSSGAALTGAADRHLGRGDAATASFVSSRRRRRVHARPRARRAAAARPGGRRRPSGVGRLRLLVRPGRRASPTTCASSGGRRRTAVSSVLLVYPFFRRSLDRSRFRFPPLGPAYVAASLRRAGHDVRLLDCTFLSRERALRAGARGPGGRGRRLLHGDDARGRRCGSRGSCAAAASCSSPAGRCRPASPRRSSPTSTWSCAARASRPWSTSSPRTRPARTWAPCPAWSSRRRTAAQPRGPPRPFARDLDALPFPARDLLPNAAYISHGRRRYGYAVTTVMSSRGCPFACEFCSNVVFGASYRERSPASVVDEVEQALALGYDRIAFADDVFTLRRERVVAVCDEIERRGLRFAWECLARVDGVDRATAARDAPRRLPDRLLRHRVRQRRGPAPHAQGHHGGPGARRRLGRPRRRASRSAPSSSCATRARPTRRCCETLRFAGSLPLDYLGLSMPYPLPGTAPARADGGPRHARVAARRQPRC